jgi:3-(3-hydroxy-phenyl)propionate hydroxylase
VCRTRQPRLKLAAVLDGQAPPALLATYGLEREGCRRREPAQLDPLDRLHHAQVKASRTIRDAALSLCRGDAVRAQPGQFRPLISTPAIYDTPLSTPDSEPFAACGPSR